MIALSNLTVENEAAYALNNAYAAETSYLDIEAWRKLVAQARLAICVLPAEAFLIGLDHTADYDSPNYKWWRLCRDRFLYIDRIVVAERAQGRGLGKALYARAIDEMQAQGMSTIVCEINIAPLNARSLIFHQQIGFEKAGEQTFPDGKTVGYFERPL